MYIYDERGAYFGIGRCTSVREAGSAEVSLVGWIRASYALVYENDENA